MSKKVCLIILDGWGHGPNDEKVNAIKAAKTPFIDSLYERYPNSELMTCGEYVGLPDGQMGNSEVGHLNIGAGRVVFQQLVRINKAFEKGDVKENLVLKEAMNYAKSHNKKVHLIGLLSDGGIHAHNSHLKGLLNILAENELEQVYVHAFTDGRDTDPKSGKSYVEDLEKHMQQTTAQISSIIGRYYAMDRDKKWDRIKLAYNLLTLGEGAEFESMSDAVVDSYENGITDEFIKPIKNAQVGNQGNIENGDVVINFNFRTDRGRQISQALTQNDFPEYDMQKLDLKYITFTEYDVNYSGVDILFPNVDLKNTLGEVMAKEGKKQLRIAETEKYPHVTFFFNGGQEENFIGEHRIMCQSPKVATYDLAPEMSAAEVSLKASEFMKSDNPDLVILNFANADMVGHTGDFKAVVKAVETVDKEAQKVIDTALKLGCDCLVTADHGNADFEVNGDGTPNTAHTTNPVPCFLIEANKQYKTLTNGKLADLAPTILELMNIDQPKEMTGTSLLD